MITDNIIHTIKREGNAYVITFKIDSAIVLDKFDTITYTHTEYGTKFEDFIHEMKESGIEVFSTRAYNKYEDNYVLRHFMAYPNFSLLDDSRIEFSHEFPKTITDNSVHNCLNKMLKFIDTAENEQSKPNVYGF